MKDLEAAEIDEKLRFKALKEMTPGLVLEGTLRSYGRNDRSEFEDEYRYAILRSDWLRLYDPAEIQVTP